MKSSFDILMEMDNFDREEALVAIADEAPCLQCKKGTYLEHFYVINNSINRHDCVCDKCGDVVIFETHNNKDYVLCRYDKEEV